jgi:hypothetical protein
MSCKHSSQVQEAAIIRGDCPCCLLVERDQYRRDYVQQLNAAETATITIAKLTTERDQLRHALYMHVEYPSIGEALEKAAKLRSALDAVTAERNAANAKLAAIEQLLKAINDFRQKTNLARLLT